MLDLKDYSELILAGVRPSLIETAETGFRAIFEASPAVPGRAALKTIPWLDIARMYGIDPSDCMVDGAVNKKKLSRKVQQLPVVGEMFDFVHRVTDSATDYADLDAYPGIESNPTFNTMLSNIRTDLLVNGLYTAHETGNGTEWWKSDDFATYLGKQVAERFMKWNPMRELDKDGYHNSGEFSGMDRDFAKPRTPTQTNGDSPVYTDVNGLTWYRDRGGTYYCRIPRDIDDLDTELVKVRTDGNKIQGISAIPRESEIDYVAGRSLGSFLAYGPELHRDAGTANYLAPDETDDNFTDALCLSMPVGAIAEMGRNRPDLLAGFTCRPERGGATSFETLQAIALMAALVKEDILDAGTIREIRGHIDTTRIPISKLGKIVGDYISPADYGKVCGLFARMRGTDNVGIGFTLDRLGAFIGRFLTDDLVELLAGGRPDRTAEQITVGELLASMRRNRASTTPITKDTVVNMLHNSMSQKRYLSPGDEFFGKVFRSDRFDPQLAGEAVMALGSLCVDGVHNRKRLFSDINKYITPRIQRKLLHRPDGGTYDAIFDSMTRTVPGFRCYVRGAGDIGRVNFNNLPLTPKQLLKFLKYINSAQGRIDTGVYAKTARELVRPEMSAMLKSENPDYCVRRIRDELGKIYADSKQTINLLYAFGRLDDDLVRAVFDTCIAPFAGRIAAYLSGGLAGAEQFRSRFEMCVRLGYLGIKYYDADPSGAARLFLDEGGIFSTLCHSTVSECVLVMSLSLMDYGTKFTRKAIGTLLLPEKDLLPRLCRLEMDTRDSGYADIGDSVADLLELDDKWQASTGEPLVPDKAYGEALRIDPSALLPLVGNIPQERAAKICDAVFTPEFLDDMARTETGLKLLLRLADIGDWDRFTTSFVVTHETQIRSTLVRAVGNDPKLAASIDRLLAKLNMSTQKHAVTRSVEHDSVSGRTSQCTVVNGLSWDRGFVTAETEGTVRGPAAVLYGIEEVRKVLPALEESGWRLPTAEDLEPLSGNPGMVAELQMGFAKTGFANGNGDIPSFSRSSCYAWCVDEGELSIYRVSNSDIDPYPDDVDPATCKAAIKPVKG